MTVFRKIWIGSGYLEGYGNHPGSSTVIVLTLVTALAGSESGGVSGFIGGLVLAGIVYGAMFLIGAYGRANSYLNAQSEQLNQRKTTM